MSATATASESDPCFDGANAIRTERPTLDLSAHAPVACKFGRPVYRIGGGLWDEGYEVGTLSADLSDQPRTWLRLGPSWSAPGHVRWEWWCVLAEGVTLSHVSNAATLEEAAATALAYAPDPVEIAGVMWLKLSEGQWAADLGGDLATIRQFGSDPAFHWDRQHRAAEMFKSLVFGRPLEGRALYLGDGGEAFAKGWRAGRADLKARMMGMSDALAPLAPREA